MKTIIVKNQAEWDALPDAFPKTTAVHIYSDPGVPITLKRSIENIYLELRENTVAYLYGAVIVGVMWDSSQVGEMRGSSQVGVMRESSQVGEMWGSSQVKAHENCSVRSLSNNVKIEAYHYVSIICQDCKPSIKRHGTGVTVVRTKTFQHSVKSFCEIFGDGNKPLTLYKSVRPDTLCDFHTGQIKYEGEVVCPDFDPDKTRQCGGGLHLSPTPQDALRYNDGRVLECRVARKDIVVYATDITKVRCRKVTVVGEWKK